MSAQHSKSILNLPVIHQPHPLFIQTPIFHLDYRSLLTGLWLPSCSPSTVVHFHTAVDVIFLKTKSDHVTSLPQLAYNYIPNLHNSPTFNGPGLPLWFNFLLFFCLLVLFQLFSCCSLNIPSLLPFLGPCNFSFLFLGNSFPRFQWMLSLHSSLCSNVMSAFPDYPV